MGVAITVALGYLLSRPLAALPRGEK
jgi:hypothetical protein